MIDHVGLHCSHYAKSKAFYVKALASLGYSVLQEVESQKTLGMGTDGKADFWLSEGQPQKPPIHLAFRAPNHQAVKEFFKAALAAGGKDNGKPGLRPQYHAEYFAAYVLDPDGHNIEVVCHDSQSESKELVQFGP